MKFRTAEKEVWWMGAVHRLCKWSQWHYSSAESMRVLSWISIRPHSAQAGSLETDIKKKKSPKLKPVWCLSLSSIYDGRFDSSELPPWTAALIVLECGLMDVGLEIKEIHPLRFCLIFKRHLTFLSGVSSLSWMSARERTALLQWLWLAPGARLGSKWGPGSISELKAVFALVTEKAHQS